MPTAQREELAGVTRAERRLAEFRKQAASLAASLEERRTQFFALAQRDGLILDNPARVVKRRKVLDKKIVIPMREEYAKPLEEIASLDERAREAVKLVQLLALTGLRLGEGTRIAWREVDFEKGQFAVSGGEAGTKNGETRIVPLFPRLGRFLEEIRPEGKDFDRSGLSGSPRPSQRWSRLARRESC